MKYKRKVKRIVDGDTFEMGSPISDSCYIRLSGVRAPSKETKRGRVATNILRGLIGGKMVTIIPVSRSYGRIVAQVFYLGKDINQVMKNKGFK